MRDGVIADFEIAEGMIEHLLKKLEPALFPAGVLLFQFQWCTEVEKRAVHDSAEHAGAKEVHLIAEPIAAAIGIGINDEAAVGNI